MVKPLIPNKVHLEKSLQIRESSIPDSGMGLFTKIDIEKNTVITEFYGEKISHTIAAARSILNKSNSILYYNKTYCIDSTIDENCLATFMNDANGFIKNTKIKNNVYLLVANGRIYVIAKRSIKCGEELFMGYGSNYWKGMKHHKLLNIHPIKTNK
jgi:hypothetical protein